MVPIEMTAAKAERILTHSREMTWPFPSSYGRPVGRGDEAAAWAEAAAAERAAFADAARFLAESGRSDEALELAANAWRLWVLAGDIAGGRQFLEAIVESADGVPSRSRALAVYGAGLLTARAGDHEQARAYNETALDVAQEVNDGEALALAHLGLSRVAFDEGDYETSRDHALKARRHAREISEAMEQAPLHLHAQAIRGLGDYDAAAMLFADSLALNRRIGDEGMVDAELHNLGHVEVHRGNGDAAARLFNELAARAPGSNPQDRALAQLNKAAVAYARGDAPAATALLAGARNILGESAIELAPDDQHEVDWLTRQLETAGELRGRGSGVRRAERRP